MLLQWGVQYYSDMFLQWGVQWNGIHSCNNTTKRKTSFCIFETAPVARMTFPLHDLNLMPGYAPLIFVIWYIFIAVHKEYHIYMYKEFHLTAYYINRYNKRVFEQPLPTRGHMLWQSQSVLLRMFGWLYRNELWNRYVKTILKIQKCRGEDHNAI